VNVGTHKEFDTIVNNRHEYMESHPYIKKAPKPIKLLM
jgi:hypothetical protein